MNLVSSIFIKRPPGAIWAFLEDPANMLLWNPKVKRVSPSSFSSPRLGYQYAITYQMRENSRASEFQAEFVNYDPLLKLVIRLTGGPSPRGTVIYESYELSKREGGAFLTQTIHIEEPGINIFWRFLIWFIQRFGKPAGKTYLETLRDIIENRQ